MAQYARPAADVVIGSWTNQAGGSANLWQAIDEDPADDADFVQSSLTVNDAYEARLSTVEAALIRSGHVLRVRARKNQAAGNTRGVLIELRQGSTVIASQSVADLTVLWPTIPLTLTKEQGALITNYSDLRVRVTATGTVSGGAATRRRVQVSFVQLRVPEATFGAVATLTGPPMWQYTLNGVTGSGASRGEAMVDLFSQLRDIDAQIENPDATQLAARAILGRRWAYAYYAEKIADYTTLRAQIANGTYILPPHQNIPEELVNIDEKLARFDAITSNADDQDGG